MINVHLQGFRIIIFFLTKVLEFFLFGCSLIISSEYCCLLKKWGYLQRELCPWFVSLPEGKLSSDMLFIRQLLDNLCLIH